MKKYNRIFSLAVMAAAFFMAASTANAQTNPTSSGTLTVTATVQSSIALVFNSDASGVALTGSGTNAATLNFGTVQAFGGTLPTGVTRTTGTNDFTVSSPVDVAVTEANSTSSGYTLTAELGSADTTNTWTVGGVTVTNSSAAQITATGAYGSSSNFPVAVTIPFSNDATNVSNTIDYVATAN